MHRIYVIRHGETEWSAAGKHTSHTDIGLTARGENQSRALAERLPVVVFDAVLTSPRQRARQTCTIAGVLPQAIIEPDLAEWEYGDYEGRLSSEISWMGVNSRTLTSKRAQISGRGIQRMSLNRTTLAGAATEAATRAEASEKDRP